MLFVFEPIDYDLERMLLMAPHKYMASPDFDKDENRYALKGSGMNTDYGFNDALSDMNDA